MEADNRAVIAKALGVAEDARNLRFILRGLDSAGTGPVKEALLKEENGGRVLDLTAESGKKYRLYLSARGNIDALLDLDAGEWLIRAVR